MVRLQRFHHPDDMYLRYSFYQFISTQFVASSRTVFLCQTLNNWKRQLQLNAKKRKMRSICVNSIFTRKIEIERAIPITLHYFIHISTGSWMRWIEARRYSHSLIFLFYSTSTWISHVQFNSIEMEYCNVILELVCICSVRDSSGLSAEPSESYIPKQQNSKTEKPSPQCRPIW